MHIYTCIMYVLCVCIYIYIYSIWNDVKQTNKMVMFKECEDGISNCHQVRP